LINLSLKHWFNYIETISMKNFVWNSHFMYNYYKFSKSQSYWLFNHQEVTIYVNFGFIKWIKETEKAQKVYCGQQNVKIRVWWAAMVPMLRTTGLDQWFSTLEAWQPMKDWCKYFRGPPCIFWQIILLITDL